MHRFRTVRLQGFDHLLPRQQRLRLVAEPVDFLDLLVELGDLGLEEIVAVVLIVDACRDHDVSQTNDGNSQDRQPDRERDELSLARLALLFPVRKKVDTDHVS